MLRSGIPSRLLIGLLFILPILAAPRAAQAQVPTTAPLRLVQTIPLTGISGFLGHMSVDATGQRLFVAAQGSNSVEIIDLRAGRRIASLGNLAQPQGILFEKVSRRLFVVCAGDGTCKAFDAAAANFPLLASIPIGGNPSEVRYAPATRQLIVGYGAGALRFIDATTLTRVADLGLAGHPEGFAVEINGSRIFVNVPDAKHVAVVDRTMHSILESWPMANLSQNYPMELDEAHNRLFVGCRSPAVLQVYESSGGGSIAQLRIDADAGDIAHDMRHARLYISCGAGRLDVISQVTPDNYQLLAAIPTAPGARTCVYDETLDRLYLAVPRRTGQEAEIRVYQPVP